MNYNVLHLVGEQGVVDERYTIASVVDNYIGLAVEVETR